VVEEAEKADKARKGPSGTAGKGHTDRDWVSASRGCGSAPLGTDAASWARASVVDDLLQPEGAWTLEETAVRALGAHCEPGTTSSTLIMIKIGTLQQRGDGLLPAPTVWSGGRFSGQLPSGSTCEGVGRGQWGKIAMNGASM
jgi:hypothetical protein